MIPPDIQASTLLAIQNTISRYCLALDTHDFSILKQVFTADIHADYSAVSPQNKDIRGLDAMIDRLMVILEGKITQHALSTQILDFDPNTSDSSSYICKAMTYFTANTFIDKNREKDGLDHVTVLGRYEDVIEEISPGEWRIRQRIVKTFVSASYWTLSNQGRMLSAVLISVNAASAHTHSIQAPVRRTATQQSRRPTSTRPTSHAHGRNSVPPKPLALRQMALRPEPLEVLSDTASFFLPSSPESS